MGYSCWEKNFPQLLRKKNCCLEVSGLLRSQCLIISEQCWDGSLRGPQNSEGSPMLTPTEQQRGAAGNGEGNFILYLGGVFFCFNLGRVQTNETLKSILSLFLFCLILRTFSNFYRINVQLSCPSTLSRSQSHQGIGTHSSPREFLSIAQISVSMVCFFSRDIFLNIQTRQICTVSLCLRTQKACMKTGMPLASFVSFDKLLILTLSQILQLLNRNDRD